MVHNYPKVGGMAELASLHLKSGSESWSSEPPGESWSQGLQIGSI